MPAAGLRCAMAHMWSRLFRCRDLGSRSARVWAEYNSLAKACATALGARDMVHEFSIERCLAVRADATIVRPVGGEASARGAAMVFGGQSAEMSENPPSEIGELGARRKLASGGAASIAVLHWRAGAGAATTASGGASAKSPAVWMVVGAWTAGGAWVAGGAWGAYA